MNTQDNNQEHTMEQDKQLGDEAQEVKMDQVNNVLKWLALHDRFDRLYCQERFKKALSVAEKCLRVAEETFEHDSFEMTTSLDNVALAYWKQGHMAEAEATYQRLVAIHRGHQHSPGSRIPSLLDLARLYERLGRYADAEPLFEEALTLAEGAGTVDTAPSIATERLANTLRIVARFYEAIGKIENAERLRVRANQIPLTKDIKSSGSQWKRLVEIGTENFTNGIVLLSQGDIRTAASSFLDAISCAEEAVEAAVEESGGLDLNARTAMLTIYSNLELLRLSFQMSGWGTGFFEKYAEVRVESFSWKIEQGTNWSNDQILREYGSLLNPVSKQEDDRRGG